MSTGKYAPCSLSEYDKTPMPSTICSVRTIQPAVHVVLGSVWIRLLGQAPWLFGLLTCALILGAVTPTGLAKETVVYQYNWYGVDRLDEIFFKLIADFEREYPDIAVEPVRGGNDPGTRLIAAIAGNVAPDVVHFERSITIEWAARGLLKPVDRLLVDSISDHYLPGAYAEVMFNGQAYGVPFNTDIRGLYWNKDHLGAAGLETERAPATLDELDAMAAKLTRTDADQRFTQIGFLPWIGNWYAVGWLYTFGKELFIPETNQPIVNTPNHVRGFEWIEEYANRYPPAQVSGTYRQYPFIEEKVSMIAEESGLVQRIDLGNPALNYGVGAVPYPAYGSNGTWMGGQAHVIPTGARNPDAARVFINWLSDKEREIEYYHATGGLPTRFDAIESVLHLMPLPHQLLLEQADVAHGRPPLWFPPIYSRTSEAMSKVINRQQPATEALNEAQRMLELDFAEVLGSQ